jgi:2-polyprenyl-6-hydroxyphenyl methylase/3-demethylubiquinone-9 3-methyltransferase
MNAERLERAKRSLLEFSGLPALAGRTFIDVGCGSGLFSWAAHELGAARVTSLDYDVDSVGCCEQLKRRSGDPANWSVFRGSILDRELVDRLGTFDVVYSWGVLHHTGDMWRAIDNALDLVADGGLFFIAIYNKKRGWRGSKYWEKRKRFYCKLPRIGQKALVGLHLAYWAQSKLLRGQNPLSAARRYDTTRGMDLSTDVADWLGGYPYEYATITEIFQHVTQRSPRMRMLNVSGGEGLGCNQFVFRRERD